MAKVFPKCKTCEQGELRPQKVYRMSIPVVIIGWLFLLPGFLGMMVGCSMMVGAGKVASDVSNTNGGNETEIRNKLSAGGVPENIIADVLAMKSADKIDMTGLDDKKKTLVRTSVTEYTIGKGGQVVAAAAGGIFSVVIIVFSFCSGLLGWLLTMKKKVLKCNACEAVIAAS